MSLADRSAVRRLSNRSEIPPFYVMEVMRAAEAKMATGVDVLHLEVGQPSTPAPAPVRAAAHAAIEGDRLGYTGAAGLPALRERIAGWHDRRYGLSVDPAQVVVTTGASGSCVLTFLALFDVGDRVGVLAPGYPCYRNDLLAFGIDVVEIPVGPETDFRPTVDQLESVGPLDGLIVASPSNPTGTVLRDDELAALARWADANAVHLVADEIYHGITYDEPAPSMLGHSNSAIVLNSFSKYFSMTGWRLGWIVAPLDVAEAAERLAQSLTVAPPTLSQVAAIAAFDAEAELDANVARYRTNRDVLIEGLHRAGITELAPADGAFYVWADVSQFGIAATDLGRRWLDELSVAVTPGIDFDQARGEHFIRFSYAGATAEITEAVDRLERWTQSAG